MEVEELKRQLEEKNIIINNLENKVIILEKEKETIIDNFNLSTNLLLNKLKDLEQKYNKDLNNKRPDTAKLLSNINENNISTTEVKENLIECNNCGKLFPNNESFNHTIKCYRSLLKCKTCKEYVTESGKEKHIFEWTNKEFINELINKEDYERIKISFRHGANINMTYENIYGYSLIHFLIYKNRKEDILFYLNNFKFDYNLENLLGDTIFHCIVKEKNYSIMKEIIDKDKNFCFINCDLNIKNFKGYTILMLCIENWDIKMIKIIFSTKSKGFKLNFQLTDKDNKSIIDLARATKNKGIIDLFISNNKSISLNNNLKEKKNFKIKKKPTIIK